MANQGDDCYFFYYSTCTKGDACPFRHCEAAMGNETVCNLWQEGRCFRSVCKFRHMEITKKRKEIPCYWENHPAGCQKPHCAFYHEKPRLIDGVFVPPDKSLTKKEEELQEEPAPPPPAPLPTPANPQLRGVKTESQEPVPSPTHPPVVINPADDDEDEDDQFSEEGEDGKVGPSPRKMIKSDGSLNFGVSTLEEIRLRKALKASMRRSDAALQRCDSSSNGEKENTLSFFPASLHLNTEAPPVLEGRGRSRGSVAERLGRRMPNINVGGGEDVPLKKSLAERLGRVMDEEEAPAPRLRGGLKSIKDRLEPAAGPTAASPEAQTSQESTKPAEKIRIKTLEEIRKEKAAKFENSKDRSPHGAPEAPAARRSPPKDAIAVRTFSEVLLAKKRGAGKPGEKPTAAGPGPEPPKAAEVRVKTLEEIRKEKAARTVEAPTKRTCQENPEENGAKKPRLLRLKKVASQAGDGPPEKTPEVMEKPEKVAPPAGTDPAASNHVQVKTFEEIMREKRLRQQETTTTTSSSSSSSAPAEPSQKPSLKRRLAPKVGPAPAGSPLPDVGPPLQKIPARRATSPRTPAAAPLSSSSSDAAASTAVTSPRRAEAPPPPPGAAKEAANGLSRNPTTAVESQDPQEKPPQRTTDTKGRPRLNVKPSVVKPAAQVKPAHKRRAGGRSAVAAVKPLNSAPAVPEEQPQETDHQHKQAFKSSSPEAHLSPAPPASPSSALLLEEALPPPVPSFRPNPPRENQPTAAAAAGVPPGVPPSSTLKSPAHTKSRKQSVGGSRGVSTSSAAAPVDDFEELMNEFADDHLEEDVDPGIGEDDLLQELSDMIDS